MQIAVNDRCDALSSQSNLQIGWQLLAEPRPSQSDTSCKLKSQLQQLIPFAQVLSSFGTIEVQTYKHFFIFIYQQFSRNVLR